MSWRPGAGSAPSGPAGGDLGGSYPNPTVDAVQLLSKGTLLAASAAATPVAVPAGLANQSPIADVGQPSGIRWSRNQYSGTFDIVNTFTTTSICLYQIPGNTLLANGALVVDIGGFFLNNTGVARGFTIGIYFGGIQMWGDNSGAGFFGSSAVAYPFNIRFVLSNEGATNAQRLYGVSSFGVAAAGSGAGIGDMTGGAFNNTPFGGVATADTTLPQNLNVLVNLSAASPSLEMKGNNHVRAVA